MKIDTEQPHTEEHEEPTGEVISDRQPYLLRSGGGVRTVADNFAEFKKTAGRFKLPRTVTERLRLHIFQEFLELTNPEVGGSFVFNDSPERLPLPWQTIMNYLYDRGVINSPHLPNTLPFNDGPKVFSFALHAVFNRDQTDGFSRISGYTRGIATDFEEAISKVIGELLERYPLTQYRRKKFLRASVRTLAAKGKSFLNPFDLAGFADWQKELFPERRFDEHSTFFWVEGTELLSGTPALIPAQLVFWNYQTRQEPHEPYLREQNTNGAAGHFTRDEAILAAIYENIQRDAFLIYWLNVIAPPKIDQTTIEDERIQRLIEQFTRYSFEVVFLNTTLDLGVPSCICVLINRSGGGPKIAIGGGCDSNLANALLRSATEVIGVYHWLLETKGQFELRKDYQSFRDHQVGQLERLLLWSSADMFCHLESFLSGPNQSFRQAAADFPHQFQSPAQELQYVMRLFGKLGKGYELYAYRAQHELLETLGYCSVRVIIPALVPLYLNEAAAPLGALRLREVPLKVGYQPAKAFNPWPHPFP